MGKGKLKNSITHKMDYDRPQFNNDQNNDRFKTALCRNFMEQGNCSYGDNCRFAHGDQELRPAPQGGFQQQGGMGGGQRGGFGGGRRGGFGGGGRGGFGGGDQGDRPQGVCRNFQQTGECRFGESCRFSH